MATETANFFLYAKYDPSQLVQSNLVNRWTTYLAGYDLCTCRGNPVPESVVVQAEKAEEKLKAIYDGQHFLPGIGLRQNQAPTWDNLSADPRFQFRVIRVERRTSSQEPTRRPTIISYPDAYVFEI